MGYSVGKKSELNEDVPSVRLVSLWRCMVSSLVGDFLLG